MLLKYTPDQLRLILIDPKQLELANYNDIPHLLTPVVTDMKDAVSALNWCVNEMERRYKLMSFLKIRKLSDYNRKVEEAIANGEDLIDPTWKPSDSATQERAPRLFGTSIPIYGLPGITSTTRTDAIDIERAKTSAPVSNLNQSPKNLSNEQVFDDFDDLLRSLSFLSC